MARKTEHQKLQERARKLGIAANQSSEELKKQIAKADRAAARKSEAAPAKGTKRAKRSESGEGKVGTPEFHNAPERTLDARQLEELEEWDGRGEIQIPDSDILRSHIEFPINFKDLRPNTNFEIKIVGPISSPYWATLKADGWGQAQLIWRTGVGGKYTVTGKGPGIDVSAEFSVSAYDADAEWRAARRAKGSPESSSKGSAKGKGKAKVSGSVATVEAPAAMGDTKAPAKAEPTPEEAADPAVSDPMFEPAKGDTETQPEETPVDNPEGNKDAATASE